MTMQPQPAGPKHRVWPGVMLVGWLYLVIGVPATIMIRGKGEPMSWHGLLIASTICAVAAGLITQGLLNIVDSERITTPTDRRIGAALTGVGMGIGLYFLAIWMDPNGTVSIMVVLGSGMGMIPGYAVFSSIIASLRRKRR